MVWFHILLHTGYTLCKLNMDVYVFMYGRCYLFACFVSKPMYRRFVQPKCISFDQMMNMSENVSYIHNYNYVIIFWKTCVYLFCMFIYSLIKAQETDSSTNFVNTYVFQCVCLYWHNSIFYYGIDMYFKS